METNIDELLDTKGVTVAFRYPTPRSTSLTWSCAGYANPEVFDPTDECALAEAQTVCAGCDVRTLCLALGVRRGEWGVWGGCAPRERQAHREGQAAGSAEEGDRCLSWTAPAACGARERRGVSPGSHAPLVQRTRRRSTKPGIQVRLLEGVLWLWCSGSARQIVALEVLGSIPGSHPAGVAHAG